MNIHLQYILKQWVNLSLYHKIVDRTVLIVLDDVLLEIRLLRYGVKAPLRGKYIYVFMSSQYNTTYWLVCFSTNS